MVASYFDGTSPVDLSDSKLTVGFAADSAFNRRNAERKECREAIGRALTEVTGESFQIDYSSLGPEQPATDPESETLGEDDFIARVKSEFNAEEVI